MINLKAESIKRYIVSGFLISILFSIANAGSLPSHYPNAFRWTGTVETISADTIVVGDREFTISSNISFNRLNSINSTASNLSEGMTIGCTLSDSGQIISIWEFPNSMSDTVGPWARGLSIN